MSAEELTDQSMYELIMRVSASHTNRPFLTIDDSEVSRGEFIKRVEARSQQLRQNGIKARDRILISSARGGAFWIDLMAVWSLGATIIPVTPTMPENRAQEIVDRASPKALLGKFAIGSTDTDDFTRFSPENSHEISQETVPAAILFTSGTTGAPKGVVLSHRALVCNALSTIKTIGLEPDDRLLIAIPFNFTSAICHFFAAGISGASFVAAEQMLFPADLIALARSSQATCFGGAPIQLRWLTEDEGNPPLSLKWVMSSGDYLPKEVISEFRQKFPDTEILTVYGLTEVGARFCILLPELIDAHAGSVGRPIEGLSVTVVDDKGDPVADGEIGELIVSGESLFDGYFRDPEITAHSMLNNGFSTGDFGFRDSNGLIFLKGRADDVFKVSGQKCSSIELEELLRATGAFADVAVMSGDDPIIGKVPVVCFVEEPGKSFSKGPVLRELRGKIPPQLIPRRFIAVPTIPRSGVGKVLRSSLSTLLDENSKTEPK